MSSLAKNCALYKTFIILATCFSFFLQNPLLVCIHRQNCWSFGCLRCHGWCYRRCIHRRNWLQALRCHWYIWNFVCWSVLGTRWESKANATPSQETLLRGCYFLGGVALGGYPKWLCEWRFRRLLKEATSKSLRIGLAQKSEFSLFGIWSVFGKNWCQPQTLWSLHTSNDCLHNCLCQNQNTNKSESPVLGRSSQSVRQATKTEHPKSRLWHLRRS